MWQGIIFVKKGRINMAKQSKQELFEKETKYCKIIRSVTVEDGDERFAIEKIYIKSLQRYEVRICLYRDCRDRINKLIPRPVDLTIDKFVALILVGLKAGVLDDDFKQELIKGLAQEVEYDNRRVYQWSNVWDFNFQYSIEESVGE